MAIKNRAISSIKESTYMRKQMGDCHRLRVSRGNVDEYYYPYRFQSLIFDIAKAIDVTSMMSIACECVSIQTLPYFFTCPSFTIMATLIIKAKPYFILHDSATPLMEVSVKPFNVLKFALFR